MSIADDLMEMARSHQLVYQTARDTANAEWAEKNMRLAQKVRKAIQELEEVEHPHLHPRDRTLYRTTIDELRMVAFLLDGGKQRAAELLNADIQP